MQQEAPRTLGVRVVNILEQLLQQLSDSSSDSDAETDDTLRGVPALILDVQALDRPEEDARLHELALSPVPIAEPSRFRRRRKRFARRRSATTHSLFPERRCCSDEVLGRCRSRSVLQVRERTPP